jgi:hypothetical protein
VLFTALGGRRNAAHGSSRRSLEEGNFTVKAAAQDTTNTYEASGVSFIAAAILRESSKEVIEYNSKQVVNLK